MDAYKHLLNQSRTKDDFISMMKIEYPELKLNTILRNYYRYRKKPVKKTEIKLQIDTKKTLPTFDSIDISEPTYQKKLLFGDLKAYKWDLTENYLMRYGFTFKEINWLKKEGLI